MNVGDFRFKHLNQVSIWEKNKNMIVLISLLVNEVIILKSLKNECNLRIDI